MQELLGEFEEKVCEIISDTIFNSIKRHHIYYTQLKQNTSSVQVNFEANRII